MNLKTGHLLKRGDYRVERVLGQGGFGITYLCEQTGLARKVAVKEFFMREYCEREHDTASITLGSSGSREAVERFRQKFIKEARALAALNHKHIVRIIDIFEENNTAYYVMEYVGGGSLSDKVKDGALPEDEAVRYIRQVATALEFVHSKHMMHLDIKPSNILLNENDETILIDFGLAKQYDTKGSQTSSTPVGISHGYAPLEQYKQGGVGTFSPATDIYSLGATLYKLLTGETPPEAGDVMNEGLPELPVGISETVRKAVETAMQPAVKKRPQSVGEFLALLDGRAKRIEPRAKSADEIDGATVVGGSVMNNEILHSVQNDKKREHVISSESEKSLDNDGKEILRSAQDDKYRENSSSTPLGDIAKSNVCDDGALAPQRSAARLTRSDGGEVPGGYVIPTERSDGEISSTDAGKTVLLTDDKLSPCFRGTSNEVAEGVEKREELTADNNKRPAGNSPKRPFNKRVITIISVVAICIIAIIFGVKSCNNRKAAEADAQQATAIAEQQRLDAERKAQERADSIAAENKRQEELKAKEEADRKAKEEAERKAKEEAERLAAEKKRKEEEERKRKETEYAKTHGTINGHEYVDLGLSVKWATCNVGASTPGDYGNYYAWGETTTKSNYTDSNSTTYGKQMNSIAGNSSYDVAHKEWGSTWRMPTPEEQKELLNNCTWTWTTQNGHNGYKVTSKKNSNSIFLPAGGCYETSSLNQGTYGYYWSATPYKNTYDAYFLCFYDGGRLVNCYYRCYGYTVRPVCE